ncbi:hypothetical protein WR25_08879 [Diploscapter pachys]|uniref:Uncharacterized protein n=1 Tax=Diploscapter pachys TaxID=2018661 RepID=A0A2A2JAT1_9BILA|nr:hypothetical protein WR25_08879 [Diploscapter pachys]
MNNSKCSDGRATQEAGGSKKRDMHANSKSKNASKSKSKSGSRMSIINKSGKRFKASAEALRDKITKKQNSKISGVSGGAEISAPPSKQSKLGRKSKEKATVSIEKKHPQQLLAVANGNANGGDKSKDQQQQQPFMPNDKKKDKEKIYSVKEAEKNNQMSVFEPIKGNVSPYQCKQRTVELKWKHKNGEKSSGTLDEAMGSSQTSAPAVNMDTVNKYRTQMQTVQRKKNTKERLSDEEEELDREMKHIKRMLEVIRMKEAAEQACGTETSNLNNWLNATGSAADANTPNETIHRLAFSMTQCVSGRKLCTLTAADGEMRLFAVRKEKSVPMIHAYIMLTKKQVAEIIKK